MDQFGIFSDLHKIVRCFCLLPYLSLSEFCIGTIASGESVFLGYAHRDPVFGRVLIFMEHIVWLISRFSFYGWTSDICFNLFPSYSVWLCIQVAYDDYFLADLLFSAGDLQILQRLLWFWQRTTRMLHLSCIRLRILSTRHDRRSNGRRERSFKWQWKRGTGTWFGSVFMLCWLVRCFRIDGFSCTFHRSSSRFIWCSIPSYSPPTNTGTFPFASALLSITADPSSRSIFFLYRDIITFSKKSRPGYIRPFNECDEVWTIFW